MSVIRHYRIQATTGEMPGAWLVDLRSWPFDPPGTVRWTRLPQRAATFSSKEAAETLAAAALATAPHIGHKVEMFDPYAPEERTP